MTLPPQERTSSRSRSTALVACWSIVAQLSTAAMIALTARRVGVEDFGAFGPLYFSSLAVAALLDFGSAQTMTRALARDRTQYDLLASWLFWRSLASIPAILVLSVVGYVIFGESIGVSAILLLALQTLGSLTYLALAGAVQVNNGAPTASAFTAAGNLVALAIAAPSPTITRTALAAATSWLASSILAFHRLRLPVRTVIRRPVQSPWRGSSGFGMVGVAVTFRGFGTLILASAAGVTAAGAASSVVRWNQPILLVPASFIAVYFPILAADARPATARRALRKFRPLFLGMAVSSVFLALLAPSLIAVVLGEQYVDAVGALRLYAFATLTIAIGQIAGTFLQCQDRDKLVGVLTLSSEVAAIALMVFVAAPLGAASHAFSLLVCSGVLALILGTILVAGMRADIDEVAKMGM